MKIINEKVYIGLLMLFLSQLTWAIDERDAGIIANAKQACEEYAYADGWDKSDEGYKEYISDCVDAEYEYESKQSDDGAVENDGAAEDDQDTWE